MATSMAAQAWSADAMRSDTRWIVHLSDAERRDVAQVARALSSGGVASDRIEPTAFAGAGFGRTLDAVERDLATGRGFVLLRGFPLDVLSPREIDYGYAAIGRRLGRIVAQNPRGDVIGAVTDMAGDWKKDPTVRGYQTRMHMDFHSDSCDVVGLLCVRPAKTGGESAIVSSVALYEHLAATAPDVLAVLTRDFCYDRRGEETPGVLPYYATALFHWHDGAMFNRYCREYIESAQRFPAAPRLTADQIRALDMFDTLCCDDRWMLKMDFRPGDIQLLNNHVILHSRTAFEDHDDPQRKRLLKRLYINNREASQRPACYASRFSDPDNWALAAMAA